jgi:hypothetical protein
MDEASCQSVLSSIDKCENCNHVFFKDRGCAKCALKNTKKILRGLKSCKKTRRKPFDLVAGGFIYILQIDTPPVNWYKEPYDNIKPWYKYGMTADIITRIGAHKRNLGSIKIVKLLLFNYKSKCRDAERAITKITKENGVSRKYPSIIEASEHRETICTSDIDFYVTIAISCDGFIREVDPPKKLLRYIRPM